MTRALLTDLYQLRMLQAYFDRGINAIATFKFFVRRLPMQRSFLVAAGLVLLRDAIRAVDARPGDGNAAIAEMLLLGVREVRLDAALTP